MTSEDLSFRLTLIDRHHRICDAAYPMNALGLVTFFNDLKPLIRAASSRKRDTYIFSLVSGNRPPIFRYSTDK
jgi:hypothetical protein